MRKRSNPRLRALPALAVCVCAAVLAGCGDDDEPAETTTETVAETGAETETETLGAETETVVPVSPEEAEREASEALRAFNRDINLGKLDEACQTYFSEALLAAIDAGSGCAGTLAVARGKGKIQMRVEDTSFDEREGTAKVHTIVGDVSVGNIRRFEFVYEEGSWKIIEILDAFSESVVPQAGSTSGEAGA